MDSGFVTTEPFSGFVEATEQFIKMVNSFKNIITSTGKKFYAITLLIEMENFHYRLQQIVELWDELYPLDIDRDVLKCYIKMFTPNNQDSIQNAVVEWCVSDNPDIPDDKIFKNIFDNFLPERDFFCYGHIKEYASFNEKEEETYSVFRKFLLAKDIDELKKIILFKFNLIYKKLNSLLFLADEPQQEVVKNIYYYTRFYFKESKEENERKLDLWNKQNSFKDNYPEILIAKKNEIRKEVENLGWDSDWQYFFYKENNSFWADDLTLGAFMKYHLTEMQADGYKLMRILMCLVDDWIYYTNRELFHIELKESLKKGMGFTKEREAAVKKDLYYRVPFEAEEPENDDSVKEITKQHSRTKQVGTKRKDATFKYVYFEDDEGVKRLIGLFNTLKSNECGWLPGNSDFRKFEQLFSGQRSDDVLIWDGTQTQLKFLFKRMVDKGLIIPQDGCKPFEILGSHFKKRDDTTFMNWNDYKAPAKRDEKAIEVLSNYLNINLNVSLVDNLFGKCNKKKGREV